MGRGFAVVRSRYSSGRLTQAVPDCETLLALAFAQLRNCWSCWICTVLPSTASSQSSEPEEWIC
jgi:hypothetical protein